MRKIYSVDEVIAVIEIFIYEFTIKIQSLCSRCIKLKEAEMEHPASNIEGH